MTAKSCGWSASGRRGDGLLPEACEFEPKDSINSEFTEFQVAKQAVT
jgi:hypothetical protein